jgi:hypothetical protein
VAARFAIFVVGIFSDSAAASVVVTPCRQEEDFERLWVALLDLAESAKSGP